MDKSIREDLLLFVILLVLFVLFAGHIVPVTESRTHTKIATTTTNTRQPSYQYIRFARLSAKNVVSTLVL